MMLSIKVITPSHTTIVFIKKRKYSYSCPNPNI